MSHRRQVAAETWTDQKRFSAERAKRGGCWDALLFHDAVEQLAALTKLQNKEHVAFIFECGDQPRDVAVVAHQVQDLRQPSRPRFSGMQWAIWTLGQLELLPPRSFGTCPLRLDKLQHLKMLTRERDPQQSGRRAALT